MKQSDSKIYIDKGPRKNSKDNIENHQVVGLILSGS